MTNIICIPTLEIQNSNSKCSFLLGMNIVSLQALLECCVLNVWLGQELDYELTTPEEVVGTVAHKGIDFHV